MRVLWLLCLLSFVAVADEPYPQRQQDLINLLKHDCGSCHGLPPNGGLGPSLMQEALSNKTDEWLLAAIQDGRPGTAMPPWKSFLTVDETIWLIRQLRKGVNNE